MVFATLHRANSFSASTRADPHDWYKPGMAGLNPAVSTDDYYHTAGWYMSRPYDLRTMGSAGAAAEALYGHRYVWLIGPDHPTSQYWIWRASADFKIGFSDDPGVMPETLRRVIWWNNSQTATSLIGNFVAAGMYEYAYLVYNSTDPDSKPFYYVGEGAGGGQQHYTITFKSTDLVTWTNPRVTHVPVPGGGTPSELLAGWSTFQSSEKWGTNDWRSIGLGGNGSGGSGGTVTNYQWLSTDGVDYTRVTTSPTKLYYKYSDGTTYTLPELPVAFNAGISEFARSASETITIGGQRYYIGKEFVSVYQGSGLRANYLSLFSCDGSGNYVTSGIAPVRLNGATYSGRWPGEYLQSVNVMQEDGIAHIYAHHGVHGQANVLRNGQPYASKWSSVNNNGTVTYSRTLPYLPVLRSSLSVDSSWSGGVTGNDIGYDDGNGNLVGPRIVSGTVNYTTGAVTVTFTTVPTGNVNFNHTQDAATFTHESGGTELGGGTVECWVDYYTYIFDATAAAAHAPVGVTASCAAGVVTLNWYNALPHQNYRVYKGSTSSSQVTLVGNVTGLTITDTPTTNQQWWYKVVTINGGVEAGFRVVHCFAGSGALLTNKHINRVLDDGGTLGSINVPYLNQIVTGLEARGWINDLQFWASPLFGYKETAGYLTKVYCLGTTRLPRGGDLSFNTTTTTYSATGVGGGRPAFVNAANNSFGYFGGGENFNPIRRKRQITIAAMYTRTQTSAAITFAGMNSGVGNIYDNFGGGAPVDVDGLSLSHNAGAPGVIEFKLMDTNWGQGTRQNSATVASDGAAIQVAVGVYDGVTMKAYCNGSGGTGNTAVDPNPTFVRSGVLAGARGQGRNLPLLSVGSHGSYAQMPSGAPASPHTPAVRTFPYNEAQFNGGEIVVLNRGLDAAGVTSLTALMALPSSNTKNLVTDFGAVGDGQRAKNITASITSNVLTVGTALFVAGDVGKAISVYAAYPVRTGTITAFTSATQVTMTTVTNLASASCEIKWGTENIGAFTGASKWRDWARTQTNPLNPPVLLIPDGHYCLSAGASTGQGLNDGVLNAKWQGVSGNADNCILSQLYTDGEMRFGGNPAITLKGLDDAGANSARLQSATKGQTTLTLVDKTNYGSRIATSRVCLIGAYDVQSNGYPPNNQFFEWNYITDYNDGVITLRDPLTQDYKSTFPEWTPRTGQQCDYGGPATIWVTHAGFDTSVELNDFTIMAVNGSTTLCRDVIMRRLKMDGFGLYPTQCRSFYADSCTWTQSIEVDKMVGEVTLENCTTLRNWQQSTSPNRMIINGGTLGTLDTARYTEANNVTFTGLGKVEIGTFYGRAEKLVMNNCTGLVELNLTGATLTDLARFSWAAGQLRYTRAGGPNLVGWMSPGSWVGFENNKYFDQVTDVTADATYIYFTFAKTTDWPLPTHTQIGIHAMPDLTVRGCTGVLPNLLDWNAAPANAPIFSYVKRTYVGGPSGTTQPAGPVWVRAWGRPISITSTVTTAYTGSGANAFLFTAGNNWPFMKMSDSSVLTNFGAAIDMKMTGARVMATAAAPVGSKGADAMYNFSTVGEAWFYGTSNSANAFSTNVVNGETPTITVEWIMDQGLTTTVTPPVENRDPISGPIGLRFRGG